MEVLKTSDSRRPSSLVAWTAAVALGLAGLALAQTAAGQSRQKGSRERDAKKVTRAYPPITTADLGICGSIGRVKATQPRAVDNKALRAWLSGTWVRQLTWHGVLVENNSALFFDLNNGGTTAMMYDQSNIGRGPMTIALDAILADPAALAATPVLTFVDCQFNIVDKYYKVSNEFLFDGLPVSGGKVGGAGSLQRTWDELSGAGFFKLTTNQLSKRVPPGDAYIPSVGGAFWKVSLTGSQLTMNGQYRGAHVGPQGNQDVVFTGVERANFVNDGGTYVTDSWDTDCAEFFNLAQPVIWERVVLSPQNAQLPEGN